MDKLEQDSNLIKVFKEALPEKNNFSKFVKNVENEIGKDKLEGLVYG